MYNTGVETVHLQMTSLNDLPKAAEMLLEAASEEPVILFEGPMGAGKTT